ISDVAQGPVVSSVIPWVRFVGTKRGKARPHVRHETARVHLAARRRGGGVAARGARSRRRGDRVAGLLLPRCSCPRGESSVPGGTTADMTGRLASVIRFRLLRNAIWYIIARLRAA